MKRFLKSQKGFTLVEVIVVAVIVAILAAVAIPLYNGYVTSSRQNVVQNAAGAAASFCAAARNSGTIPTVDVTARTITGAQNTIFNFPVGVTMSLGGAGSIPAGGTVTATDTTPPGYNATQNW